MRAKLRACLLSVLAFVFVLTAVLSVATGLDAFAEGE